MNFSTIFIVLISVVIGFLLNSESLEIKFRPRKFTDAVNQLIKHAKKVTNAQETEASSSDNKNSKNDVDAPDLLKQHSELFNKPEIIKVHESKEFGTVYSAIGFGLANCLLFDDHTEDGLIMVDAMESEEAMYDVIQGFEKQWNIIIDAAPKISGEQQLQDNNNKKPKARRINTLIYTHFHQDHTNGARVANSKRIVAFELTKQLLTHSPITGPITYTRGMRQFGVMVPEDLFINSGIGPELRLKEGESTPRLVLPTETFSTPTHTMKVGKWNLKLFHCPGETPDQIVIHFPDIDLLVASDNIYESFPNLFAIRGTKSRDSLLWAKCVGHTMRALQPEILLPLHTRPVHGKDKIYDLLTDYSDAIKYIHDQTVYHMNRGLFPDDIVQKVRLPKHLNDHPWLQPFYGTVHWSVRAVFSHYMGWFGGDAKELQPSKPGTFAAEVLKILSNASSSSSTSATAASTFLLDRARVLLTESSSAAPADARELAQLALELTSLVLSVPSSSVPHPPNQEAKSVRRAAYSRLAALSVPATGRNYYQTFSLELDGDIEIKIPQSIMSNNLHQIDLGKSLLDAMAVNLDASVSEDADWLVRFEFTDTNEPGYYFYVRRGVVDIFEDTQKTLLKKGKQVDLEIITTKKAWVSVLTKEKSPVLMIATKEINIKTGGLTEMLKFRTLFSSPRD